MLPPSSLPLSVLLLSLLAVVSSSASSSPSRLDTVAKRSTGLRIPLSKRFSLFSPIRATSTSTSTSSTDDDADVANLDNLKNALSVAQNKFYAGASTYSTKTGETLSGFSADSVEMWVSELTGGLLKKRQSDTLTNYLDDTLWAGTVSVGTPTQDFTIDFDTGSADFWIPGAAVGGDYTCFDTNASSTAVQSSKNFSILYGDGSTVKGPVYTDTVSIAGLSATKQSVAVISTMEADFFGSSLPVDGILGMGYESISNMDAPPFFQTLFSQGVVDQNVFSFVLGDTDEGELYLGGYDESKIATPVYWSPVTTQAYWTIEGSVGADNETIASSQDFIVDTGTTLIIGSVASVKKFFANVPTAKEWQSGYWQYECSQTWTASFTFSGVRYVVSSESLNLGKVASGSEYCVAGIAGQDVGTSAWILGDIFLKTVMSVFDLGENRVGFAKLASDSSSSSSAVASAAAATSAAAAISTSETASTTTQITLSATESASTTEQATATATQASNPFDWLFGN